MKHICLFLVGLIGSSAQSQTTFTKYLTSRKAGQGEVIIHQNKDIETIVNNIGTGGHSVKTFHEQTQPDKESDSLKKGSQPSSPSSYSSNKAAQSFLTMGKSKRRRKSPGYRIQIYTGGNSRTDRTYAEKYGRICKENFPELSTYIHFLSPRWICRVGDFKTHEEAAQYASKIRKEKIFREVSIIKCTIWVSY